MELPQGFVPDYIQLKVEYAYNQDAKSYCPEVMMVQDVVRGHSLRKAEILVPLGKAKTPVESQIIVDQATAPKGKSALVEFVDDGEFRLKAGQFIEAIRSRNYHSIDGLFDEEGLVMYNQLLGYGTPCIHGTPDFKVFRSGQEIVVRSIPMSFSFINGARKSIVEDLVLSFNEDGKIHWLSFALDMAAADDILTKGAWSDEERQTILSFMEDYKTAYCLERIDYLDQIFSDDALIIVGHVLKRLQRNNDNDRVSLSNNKLVKRTQYKKSQYIEHLKACFDRNECINIHFADNDITKAGKGGSTFGIQIKQDYYSTTYGDSGYLFLVVDFNKPNEPTILVRVWQEEPDPEFGLANLDKLQ